MDPDLAFQVNPDPDPGSESRVLMTKKSEEKSLSFFDQNMQFTYP
jgi:hypothetical protein